MAGRAAGAVFLILIHQRIPAVTIVRVGPNDKYASNWEAAFSGKKGKSASKKSSQKTSAKAAKKSAQASTKKKPAKKKKK